MTQIEAIIIGGGIVGLATAYNLSRKYPDIQLTILEKENELSFHQSGRNSGPDYGFWGSSKGLCRRCR